MFTKQFVHLSSHMTKLFPPKKFLTHFFSKNINDVLPLMLLFFIFFKDSHKILKPESRKPKVKKWQTFFFSSILVEDGSVF